MPDHKSPQFSIIIPLYNKEAYIIRALTSALNQTFSDFEIIIINDACTDNSLYRIKEIKDKRLRILHRETPGPGGYAARNLGIAHAQGAFISFLDADDEWMPCYLEQIILLINKYPQAGAYFTAYESIFDNRKKINKFSLKNKQWKTKYVSRKEFFLSVARSMSPVLTSCFTVKKKCIREAGGFPEGKCKKGGDVETWMRIGLLCDFSWSSYKGLIYYGNIPDQVTAIYSGPEVPYAYHSAKKILDKLDKKQAFLIKKYVNYYIKWNIQRSLIRNQIMKELLYVYFKEVNITVYIFYKILYSLPSLLRTVFYKFYNNLKKIIQSMLIFPIF
ncbi:MAG: glycosyltransferase family 2 protein [Spirochaetales bacterium]|nr:glycosyltransferase family 2 protein [Spirochaetales bacterium]